MSSTDEVKVMLVEELSNYFCPKSEGYTSIIFSPAHCVLGKESSKLNNVNHKLSKR